MYLLTVGPLLNQSFTQGSSLCSIATCFQIGYSNPNTMTDKSSMVKRGHKGDASILRPTIMGAVPLILDRYFDWVGFFDMIGGRFVKFLTLPNAFDQK
jgi:hypothetical protein